jgi:hypothetical protein
MAIAQVAEIRFVRFHEDGSAIYKGEPDAHWTDPDTNERYGERCELVLPRRLYLVFGDTIKVTIGNAD